MQKQKNSTHIGAFHTFAQTSVRNRSARKKHSGILPSIFGASLSAGVFVGGLGGFVVPAARALPLAQTAPAASATGKTAPAMPPPALKPPAASAAPGTNSTSSAAPVGTPTTGTPFVRGMEAYRAGDFSTARTLLAQAVATDPANGDAQAVLGYLLAQNGQLDSAFPHLEKAITLKTTAVTSVQSHLNLGKALLLKPDHTNADTDRAVSLFEQAKTLPGGGRSEDVEMTLGYAYTRLGRYDQAADAYLKATDLAPRDAAAWKMRGLALRQNGQNDAASDALQKSAALNSSDADTWEAIGQLAQSRSDLSAAQNALETAHKLDAKNVPVAIELGALYVQEGRFADAGDTYGAAADLVSADAQPDTEALASLRYDQGVALAKAGRMDDAAAAYDKALAAKPQYAEALLNSGFILYKEGKLEGAAARFQSAADIMPSSTLAWQKLATVQMRRRDWPAAAAAWRKVAALDPSSYTARDLLVQALLSGDPLSEEAVKVYLQMAHLRPKSADPMIGLALLYERQAEAGSLASYKQGKLLAALESLQTAVGRNPHSSVAYNDIGVVHERRGEIPEAIACYKKALAIDPKQVDARNNLARFQQGARVLAQPAAAAKP